MGAQGHSGAEPHAGQDTTTPKYLQQAEQQNCTSGPQWMEMETQILSPLVCCRLCSWWLLQPFSDLGQRLGRNGGLGGKGALASVDWLGKESAGGHWKLLPQNPAKVTPGGPSGNPLSHSIGCCPHLQRPDTGPGNTENGKRDV